MDRREEVQHERNLYQKELEEQKEKEIDFSKQYVMEDGKKFRVPYRMVKRIVFSNVSKAELRDMPHAARLQYRLMLKDSILKATVNFTKSTITVTYNPESSDNLKEKISQKEIIDFLVGEGIHVNAQAIKEEDYDYYKNFYSYAYNPPTIRERAPYGYTPEQWQKQKPEWEEKLKKGNLEKVAKHRAFQEEYLEENPEIAAKIDPNFKPGTKKLSKKKGGAGKGFWFHGI